jgi:uncharacterized protein (UPF0128 family)
LSPTGFDPFTFPTQMPDWKDREAFVSDKREGKIGQRFQVDGAEFEIFIIQKTTLMKAARFYRHLGFYSKHAFLEQWKCSRGEASNTIDAKQNVYLHFYKLKQKGKRM